MALANYTDLQAAVAGDNTSWSNRSDLTAARIQDFIRITESRTLRGMRKNGVKITGGLRTRELEKRADLTLDVEFVTLPTDFIQMKRIYLDKNPRTVLDYVSPFSIDKRFPSTDGGDPNFFTIEAGVIKLKPAPSSAVTGKLLYWFRPVILSSGNSTNELLTNYPDIMLWGALAELWDFLKDRSKEDEYRMKWADSIEAANEDATANEASGSALTPQYYADTP